MGVLKRFNSKNYYIQFQYKGKTYCKSSRTANRQVAVRLEKKWLNEIIEKDLRGIADEIQIEKALEMYLELKKGTAGYTNVKGNVKFIRENIDASKPLSELSSAEVERLKQKRANEFAPATVKHTINTLRGAWKNARKLGYHTQDIDFPTVRVNNIKMDYMSTENVERLLEELDPSRQEVGLPNSENQTESQKRIRQDNYDLVLILSQTGARYNEIATLRWSQVDLTERTIDLQRSKTNNQTSVYMTDAVFDTLVARFKSRINDRYVFCDKTGTSHRKYSPIAIRKAFERSGLKGFSMHDLRHYYATFLVKNGLTLFEVQNLLGHSSPSTTKRYSHLELGDVSKSAAAVFNN